MKHIDIDKCKCGHKWCDLNRGSFIFYHDVKFYLITFNTCVLDDDLDSRELIISKILNKSKQIDYYSNYYNGGRMNLDDSLREERLRNLPMNRKVYEVNLIYKPVGRDFKCIATPVSYKDLALAQNKIEKSYKDSILYLTNNGYKYHLEELERLKNENKIYSGQKIEIETVKSIDKLIKTIKDDIKTKS